MTNLTYNRTKVTMSNGEVFTMGRGINRSQKKEYVLMTDNNGIQWNVNTANNYCYKY